MSSAGPWGSTGGVVTLSLRGGRKKLVGKPSLFPVPGKSVSTQCHWPWLCMVREKDWQKIRSNRESSVLIISCCHQAKIVTISGRQQQKCLSPPTLKPLHILCLKVQNNELSLCDSTDVKCIVSSRNFVQSVCPSASITWHILCWLPRLRFWSKHKQNSEEQHAWKYVTAYPRASASWKNGAIHQLLTRYTTLVKKWSSHPGFCFNLHSGLLWYSRLIWIGTSFAELCDAALKKDGTFFFFFFLQRLWSSLRKSSLLLRCFFSVSYLFMRRDPTLHPSCFLCQEIHTSFESVPSLG